MPKSLIVGGWWWTAAVPIHDVVEVEEEEEGKGDKTGLNNFESSGHNRVMRIQTLIDRPYSTNSTWLMAFRPNSASHTYTTLNSLTKIAHSVRNCSSSQRQTQAQWNEAEEAFSDAAE
jgi:hypothetical protein